jgi:hypothetical protein
MIFQEVQFQGSNSGIWCREETLHIEKPNVPTQSSDCNPATQPFDVISLVVGVGVTMLIMMLPRQSRESLVVILMNEKLASPGRFLCGDPMSQRKEGEE